MVVLIFHFLPLAVILSHTLIKVLFSLAHHSDWKHMGYQNSVRTKSDLCLLRLAELLCWVFLYNKQFGGMPFLKQKAWSQFSVFIWFPKKRSQGVSASLGFSMWRVTVVLHTKSRLYFQVLFLFWVFRGLCSFWFSFVLSQTRLKFWFAEVFL